MTLGDPNAHLGHAGAFASILIISVVILGGLIAICALTWVLGVRSCIGINVSLVYLAIGSLAYVLIGPFALSPDGPVYDAQALSFATKLGYTPEPSRYWPLDDGKWGWPIILSVFYAIDGRVPLTGVLINSIVMGLVVVTSAKASLVAFERVSYPTLYALFLLFPGFLLLGPTSMREPLVWLGLALLALGFAYCTSGERPLVGLLLIALAIVLVAWIRFPLGVLVLFGLGSGLITGALWERYRGIGVLAGFSLVSIGVLLFVDNVAYLVGYDLTEIVVTRNYLSSAATTGFAVNAGPLSSLGATPLIFATFFKILLGPFPWEMGREVVWLWVVANTSVWWVVLLLTLRSLKRVPRKRPAIVLLTLAAVILLGMGLTLTNYGIVVRLRTTPLVILAIVLAAKGGIGRSSEPQLRERSIVSGWGTRTLRPNSDLRDT